MQKTPPPDPDGKAAGSDDTDPLWFAHWLKDRRQRSGMTLEQLAQEVRGRGYSTSINKLWRIENGATRRVDHRLKDILESCLAEATDTAARRVRFRSRPPIRLPKPATATMAIFGVTGLAVLLSAYFNQPAETGTSGRSSSAAQAGAVSPSATAAPPSTGPSDGKSTEAEPLVSNPSDTLQHTAATTGFEGEEAERHARFDREASGRILEDTQFMVKPSLHQTTPHHGAFRTGELRPDPQRQYTAVDQ